MQPDVAQPNRLCRTNADTYYTTSDASEESQRVCRCCWKLLSWNEYMVDTDSKVHVMKSLSSNAWCQPEASLNRKHQTCNNIS